MPRCSAPLYPTARASSVQFSHPTRPSTFFAGTSSSVRAFLGLRRARNAIGASGAAQMRHWMLLNQCWSRTRRPLAFLAGMASEWISLGGVMTKRVVGTKRCTMGLPSAGHRGRDSRLMRQRWRREGRAGHARRKNSLDRLGWPYDRSSSTTRILCLQSRLVGTTLTLHRRFPQDAGRYDGTLTSAPARFVYLEHPLPLMGRGNCPHRAQLRLLRAFPRVPNLVSNRIRHHYGGMALPHTADLLHLFMHPRFAFCLRRLYSMGPHPCSSRHGSRVVALHQHKDMGIGMVLRPLVS